MVIYRVTLSVPRRAILTLRRAELLRGLVSFPARFLGAECEDYANQASPAGREAPGEARWHGAPQFFRFRTSSAHSPIPANITAEGSGTSPA